MSKRTSGQTWNTSRRTLLKTGAVVSFGGASGVSMLSGQAAAQENECTRVCWIDIKPNSCPNSINAGNNGVVSVASGWPHFDPETVRLVPIKAEYDAAFGTCQDYRNPVYRKDSEVLARLLERSDGRGAEAIRSTVEDADGDGDADTVFKFRTRDIGFEADDTYAILVGETFVGSCTVLGIDSVRVLHATDDRPAKHNGHSRGRGRPAHAGKHGKRSKTRGRWSR